MRCWKDSERKRAGQGSSRSQSRRTVTHQGSTSHDQRWGRRAGSPWLNEVKPRRSCRPPELAPSGWSLSRWWWPSPSASPGPTTALTVGPGAFSLILGDIRTDIRTFTGNGNCIGNTKNPQSLRTAGFLAEKEGFEPSRPFRSLHDFQEFFGKNYAKNSCI